MDFCEKRGQILPPKCCRYHKVLDGVCDLSAFLLTLFIEDILQAVAIEESGCYIGISEMNAQAYADDFVKLFLNVSRTSKTFGKILDFF